MDERGPLVGIDLGGTNMQVGVVDGAGRVLGRARARTRGEEGPAAVIRRMAEGVREACRGAGVGVAEVRAIGVGAPAPIDHARGVVTHAPNLKWTEVALADELRSLLSEGGAEAPPVYVDNDVNAAAYGEHRLGAGRGYDDMMAVWIGTGLGGGLVLRGSVYQGPLLTGGEVGQMILLPDAPEGMRSVESRCSRTAIARELARRTGEPEGTLSAEVIAQRCLAGDADACAVVERAMDLLGVAVANMVTVLGLPRVVVGGGLTELLGEWLVGRVRASTHRNVFYAQSRGVEVVETALRENAGVLGAAMLAGERAF